MLVLLLSVFCGLQRMYHTGFSSILKVPTVDKVFRIGESSNPSAWLQFYCLYFVDFLWTVSSLPALGTVVGHPPEKIAWTIECHY